MSYTPFHADWKDRFESLATPVTAAFLEYLEAGLVAAAAIADQAAADAADALDQLANLSAVPIGTIGMWPTNTPPTDWLIMDGSTFDAGTYPDLNTLLGGNVLPNWKGRTAVGRDNAQVEFDTVLEQGGAKTHTLTEPEMRHQHTVNAHGHTLNGGSEVSASGTAANTLSATTGNASPGTGNPTNLSVSAHNNLQPYAVGNWIIKAK